MTLKKSTSIRLALARNNGQLRLCEVHDRASTELVRDSTAENGGSFDGVWISGLTQTTVLGIPDTELISPLHRAILMQPVDKPLEHNTRQLCGAFDADSGGPINDIPALVTVLVLKGVSMIIIEDKAMAQPGQKVNSLLATSDAQGQADKHKFAKVIRAFKDASIGHDVMITARIESFTTRPIEKDPVNEQASRQASLQNALSRAQVYTEAGADAIMIHSKSKDPEEILNFLRDFRSTDQVTPLVVVPTTYSKTARSELADAGANVYIYANHLMRAKIMAAAEVFEMSKLVTKNGVNGHSSGDELHQCQKSGNYGCLLRKLAEKRYLGESESKEDAAELINYGLIAEKKALENMRATVLDLAGGELSGCEADERIISVKELLVINARQVSPV